jgi:hypothetical protein
MRKLILTLALIAAFGLPAAAQEIEFGAPSRPLQNDGSTGTTLNAPAKVIAATNTAINAGTGDTTIPTFICMNNCGTSGLVGLATNGQAQCIMDSNQSSAGEFFVINSTTTVSGPRCHAQAAAPANGTWVIGFLSATSTTAGALANVWVNGFFYGSSTGGGGGANPGGAVCSSQFQVNSTTFGGTTDLCVVNGGAGSIAALTLVANTKYLITASDTETAAKNVTVPNVTIECPPGVTIQQTTASTDMWFLTTGANNFTVIGCSAEMPSTGTMGVWLNTDPLHPVNYVTVQNLTINSLSSTATNGGAGWINFSGGTGHRVINSKDPFSNEHIVVVDNQTPSTHNQIDDPGVIGGDYIINADGKYGLYVLNNSLALAATRVKWIGVTCAAVGGCFLVDGNANIESGDFSGNVQWITGSSGSSHLTLLACDYCNVGPIEFFDGGPGGNHSGKSMMSVSNGVGKNYHDLTFRSGLNNIGPPFISLDDHGNTFSHITCGGPGGSKTVLNSTGGWATNQPCMLFQVDNTSNISSDNILDDIVAWMPPSSTADGIDFTCSFASSICDRYQIGSGVKIIGQGSTGACIKFTNTGGTGSSSTNHSIADGATCQGFATGVNIGSNVNNTKIGQMNFVSVTNRFSDSGTGTILKPLTVANVTKTSQVAAITATTLFTPDANAGYRVNVSVNCDNSSAAATVNPTISWTDPSNQAQSQSLTSAATCTALGSGSFGQLAFPFRAKSGTNIQYSTAIANTPTYDISITLEQVTTN